MRQKTYSIGDRVQVVFHYTVDPMYAPMRGYVREVNERDGEYLVEFGSRYVPGRGQVAMNDWYHFEFLRPDTNDR